MADIDWGILAASIPKPVDAYTATLQGNADRRAQAQTQVLQQNQALDQQKFDAERAAAAQKAAVAQRQAVAQQAAAGMFKSGDVQGAQATMIGAGLDPSTLNASVKQNTDQARAGTGEFAGIVKAIGALPYEQRKPAIAQIAPYLVSNHDVTQAQIDAFDPTDQNIAGLSAYGYSAEKQDDHQVAAQTADTNALNAQTQAKNADITARRLDYDISKPLEMDPSKNYVVPNGASAGPVSGAQVFGDFTLKHEGGFNPKDANGAPVNFGVNQAAHPNVDVKNLTPQGAAKIFNDEYFVPVGAASMPPALGAIAADTAYITGVGRAKAMVARSGGDPAKLLQLRQDYLDSLVASNPAKYGKYAQTWRSRTADLATYASGLGGGSSGASSGGGVPGFTTIQTGGDPNAIGAPGDVTKTGAAYLATLPAGMRSTVLAISDGRVAAPSSRSKENMALLAAVTQYDPTFDVANSKTRVATRLDFTSGKSSRTVNAIGTAIGHAYELYDQVDKLDNFDGAFSGINGLVNPTRRFFGNKEIPSFEQNALTYANELEAVYRASGGTEAEVQRFHQNLSSANGPSQIKNVITGMIAQLNSKLGAMAGSYAQGMGRSDATLQIISPQNALKMQKMGVKPAVPIAPEASIAYLRAHPGSRAMFDKTYGAGASEFVLGGK